MRFTPRKLPRFRPPRMGWCMALAVVLLLGVARFAPQNLPVIMYKGSLLTLASVGGYWLARWVFPYGRPDQWLTGDRAVTLAASAGAMLSERMGVSLPIGPGTVLAVAVGMACVSMICRALLMLGAMLAVGLGL
ncbi:holin [Desulfovibrio sp. A2]|nr:holin [Desulfovibrio sp. A2]